MNISLIPRALALGAAVLGAAGRAAESVGPPAEPRPPDRSFQYEIVNALAKALDWYAESQNADGSWSQAEYPALTGLVLTSFLGEPTGRLRQKHAAVVDKGFEYILKCVQPDGGIYSPQAPAPLESYNTAVCLTALVFARRPEFEPVIRRARNYLVSLQNDGGIGYNKTGGSDLSNTVLALEALYYTRSLVKKDVPEGMDRLRELDWDAAVRFVERCQNLPEYNKEPWASGDPQNRGGFVYSPTESKAGGAEVEPGRTALRSYGSMSYAGLLSYIYADLAKDDPRVAAVVEWLGKNYTLDENPGMGAQGLYYYFHTMAKALNTYGVQEFALDDGRRVPWRRELALRLLSLQDGQKGFWMNENGRWWEKDPVLATAYATIALEIIYRGL